MAAEAAAALRAAFLLLLFHQVYIRSNHQTELVDLPLEVAATDRSAALARPSRFCFLRNAVVQWHLLNMCPMECAGGDLCQVDWPER